MKGHDMTHLSLFSGIGGLDLAAEWAGFETVGQCEWADFPNEILTKHWPNVPKWRDINGLSAADLERRTGERTVTLISGGFPCQPHSVAGERKASDDERDLWPEMRRVIGEIKPRWVVAENVPGLLTSEDGRFFRGVLRDFASLGFDAWWGTFSAAAVGAVHRRDRVAIVAHANRKSKQRVQPGDSQKDGGGGEKERQRSALRLLTRLDAGLLATLQNGHTEHCKPLITRNDDGFHVGLDRAKALGNAVVPQQFYPIFKAIADIERGAP